MNGLLNLLGLAKKAGRLELGEEPVGAACRSHKARVVLLAADAADNTIRRATHFSEIGAVPLVLLPSSKAELGTMAGRASCAMLALTDVGFAASLVKKLAAIDPEQYGEAAGLLSTKAEKAQKRQKEMRAHEKKIQLGKAHWSTKSAQPSAKKKNTDQ
jgi:ribosomal protein L7Ae-like RNA K-turn-binding protein